MNLAAATDSELRAAISAAQLNVQSLFSRGAYGQLAAACAERDAIAAEQRARRDAQLDGR